VKLTCAKCQARLRWLIPALAVLVVCVGASVALMHSLRPDLPELPKWEPHDFAFTTPTAHDKPFDVQFGAKLSGPDGIELRTLGFHDGDGTWKVRVCPTAEGRWTLTTKSDDPELDGKRVAFTCVPNPDKNVHGGLRVDREHPRHFVYEDGTRHFLMGYECDWLWALDMGDAELTTLGPFLDKLAAHGFNHVLLNSYARDTAWSRGKRNEHDYGPPGMIPWQGTHRKPDYGQFNLAYWQHYDRVINALRRRGITAHIMIKVYNKDVNWPPKGGGDDDLYFRWLVARYAAYPNVVWDLAKEAQRESDRGYKRDRLRFIRELDPYDRLITVHDDTSLYDSREYDKLVDFRCDQNHSRWHEKILRQAGRHEWPIVKVEFGYEHGPGGPGDMTYTRAQSPEEVCRRAWHIVTAGGYPAYYYTYTAWDVIRPDHTPPGYAYFKHLRAFFDRTGYWLMKPSDKLVSDGFCLANSGIEYIVYLHRSKSFRLKLAGLKRPLPAEWFHPLTGQTEPANPLGNGRHTLTPPSAWKNGPAVLHVGQPPPR